MILQARRKNGGIYEAVKVFLVYLTKGDRAKGKEILSKATRCQLLHTFPLWFTTVYYPHFTDEQTGTYGHIAGPGELILRSNSNTFLSNIHSC